MSRLKYKKYDDYVDYDGPILLSIAMEENGVIYTYNIEDKTCYVSGVEEGVENVVIADEIRVDGFGICPVVRWGIPLVDEDCVRNVKSIELGRNIKEFDELKISGLKHLEKLVIPETIEKFKPYWKCDNLKEITLPDKFEIDWEEFSWSHPKLKKITLLHDGSCREIGEKEISSMRYSYQRKVDKEEFDRITEEKKIDNEKKRQESIMLFTERYNSVVCAIPYIWVLVNGVKNMVNFDLDLFQILFQLLAACALAFGLFLAWAFAVMSAIVLTEHSKRKKLTALIAPILTVPFSWIVFNIFLGLLTAFNSCSSGFYGIIDPRFIN